MSERKNQKGITLIELIIVVAIMGILATAMVLSLSQSVRLYGKESTSVSLEDTLRAVQDRMVRDLRPCFWAEEKTSGSNNYLYFSLSPSVPNYNQYYKYDSASGLLYRKLTGGAEDPIAEKVITATWSVSSRQETITTPTPVTLVKYDIFVELRASQKDVTKTTSFLVTLRNYK